MVERGLRFKKKAEDATVARFAETQLSAHTIYNISHSIVKQYTNTFRHAFAFLINKICVMFTINIWMC
jgi:hypothetical protein